MRAGISAYGLKINMLYVVILFYFLRQCVGVVSLCEESMAYAFLFAICWYRRIRYVIKYCFEKIHTDYYND